MLEVIKAKIDTKVEFNHKKFRTWAWADPSMLKILDDLRANPEKHGAQIAATGFRKIYRLDLPDGSSVAYKTGCPDKKFSSIAFRELINYRIFRNAYNIPLPRLLACGEVKRGMTVQDVWIMTRFAAGYQNGRELQTADPGTRKDFLVFNMPIIAKLHKAGCYHRGFLPENILMKREEDGSLDCLWLEAASSRFYFLPALFLRPAFLDDLVCFFRAFSPSTEELELALTLYVQGNPRSGMNAKELLQQITNRLRTEK